MRSHRLLPLLLLSLGLGCNQAPQQPTAAADPEKAQTGAEPTQADAVALPAPAAPNANPGQPPAEPVGLSDPEKNLLRIAARPEPYGGAPDLSMACTATVADKDRMIRERSQPGMRLAEADREAVRGWWEPVGKSLKEIDDAEIKHILFTERAELVRCVEKTLATTGSNRSSGPDPICVAYATQDPGKCDPKLTSFSACRTVAQGKKWGAQILAWDRNAPDFSICDKQPVSALFFDQEMCKIAVEKNCEAMVQAMKVKVCNVWQSHKAPFPCEGDAKQSFWCQFEKVVNAKDVKKACQDLLGEGNYAIPDQWCDLLIQPATGDCISGLATQFDVPEMALQGCGIIELAMGKERNCAGNLTHDQQIFCVGRFLGNLIKDPSKVSCSFLPKEFDTVCRAAVEQAPELCTPSIEANPDDRKAAEQQCLKLYIKPKQMPPSAPGEPPVNYLEYIAPKMNVGECVLTVSVPAPDGTVWKFPIDLVVLESAKRWRLDLPKAITDVKGMTVEQKCTWVPQQESPLYIKSVTMVPLPKEAHEMPPIMVPTP